MHKNTYNFKQPCYNGRYNMNRFSYRLLITSHLKNKRYKLVRLKDEFKIKGRVY